MLHGENAWPYYGSAPRPGMCAAVRNDGNNFTWRK